METHRPRVGRPPGGAYAFACTRCLLVYRDGVDYATCVRCDGAVDWIDDRATVFACRACDRLSSGAAEATSCARCEVPMTVLSVPSPRRASSKPPSVRTMASYALMAFVVVQTLFAVVDPNGFPYLKQILLIAQLFGLAVVMGIAIVARDIRSLIDHRTRIIHGLEHATIRVLEERGITVRSGRTYRGEFLLWLAPEGRTYERFADIRNAARDAIVRVMSGEHALAYSPECGTSYVVTRCLYAIAIVAAGLGASALGAPTGIVWTSTVVAGAIAHALAPRTGLRVQRCLTVSTDIARARVTDAQLTVTADGDCLLATIALDVEPTAREGGLVSPTALG